MGMGSQSSYDYDYIIIGSGFGGSVSAMRLVQKGYSVAVLEAGKRYRTGDFPKSNWNLRKYLWMPWLGLYGIQRLNLLDDFFLAHWPFQFARRTMILLVMQTADNSIRMLRRRRWFFPFKKTMSTTISSGEPAPRTIPIANETTRKLAKKTGGVPVSTVFAAILNKPLTGHIMGGCVMGESPETGAIDFENRVYGYENLRVCDSSMLPVNLGVNPSLSITALTERAMSRIPAKAGAAVTHFRFEDEEGITSVVFPQEKRRGKKLKKLTGKLARDNSNQFSVETPARPKAKASSARSNNTRRAAPARKAAARR